MVTAIGIFKWVMNEGNLQVLFREMYIKHRYLEVVPSWDHSKLPPNMGRG